jgi:hypothetical protein
MASSDLFTISALLVLIMGAACFYLYTRIKQAEKKLALVEGILLDLKTATEASFMDFPAATSYLLAKDLGAEDDEDIPETSSSNDLWNNEDNEETEINAFEEDDDVEDLESQQVTPVQVTKVEEENQVVELPSAEDEVVPTTPDLELLNVKELMAIARSKGLSISKTMRKQQIIDAINAASSLTTATIDDSGLDGANNEPSFISGTTLESAPF